MRIIVTGGLGFIGSAVVRQLAGVPGNTVLNIDKRTYAGNPESVAPVAGNDNYHGLEADIVDTERMRVALREFKPDAILHLAAESHVDRSITGPGEFVHTNVVGTFSLLQAAREYWLELDDAAQQAFRFIHVSTDEVFGSLGATGAFTETTPYQPNSPYSASKAGSDHLARAWHHTYGMPVIVTNCSNNYGPYQFPEKLIPLVTLKCLASEAIPVYGQGENVRDWLFVEDHVDALLCVLQRGVPGATYNIGGECEVTNLEVVKTICGIVDELRPAGAPREQLIEFVTDRPGHDFRYAMDISHIRRELDWAPRATFAGGIRQTVQWYMDNVPWWQAILDGSYQLERLGVSSGSAA